MVPESNWSPLALKTWVKTPLTQPWPPLHLKSKFHCLISSENCKYYFIEGVLIIFQQKIKISGEMMAGDPAMSTSSALELSALRKVGILRYLWSAGHQWAQSFYSGIKNSQFLQLLGPAFEKWEFFSAQTGQMGSRGGDGSLDTVSCWEQSKGSATFDVPLKNSKFLLKKPPKTKLRMTNFTSGITRWKWITSSRCNKF